MRYLVLFYASQGYLVLFYASQGYLVLFYASQGYLVLFYASQGYLVLFYASQGYLVLFYASQGYLVLFYASQGYLVLFYVVHYDDGTYLVLIVERLEMLHHSARNTRTHASMSSISRVYSDTSFCDIKIDVYGDKSFYAVIVTSAHEAQICAVSSQSHRHCSTYRPGASVAGTLTMSTISRLGSSGPPFECPEHLHTPAGQIVEQNKHDGARMW
jgi:hypothetical protein